MSSLKTNLENAEIEIETIIRRQMQLGFNITNFPEMDSLKMEIKPVQQLWETIEQFDKIIENWKNQPLAQIQVE